MSMVHIIIVIIIFVLLFACLKCYGVLKQKLFNFRKKKKNGLTQQGEGGEEDDQDNEEEEDSYRPPVDLEERDPDGATPLHVALLAKRLNPARLLLESGAGTTKRLEGSTPAHIALSVASIRRFRGFADA